jgi:hypothetical protein
LHLERRRQIAVCLMPHVRVTDDGWIPTCAKPVHELVHKHGGLNLSQSVHASVRRTDGMSRFFALDDTDVKKGTSWTGVSTDGHAWWF